VRVDLERHQLQRRERRRLTIGMSLVVRIDSVGDVGAGAAADVGHAGERAALDRGAG
jgi:hypothetical protein